MGNIELGEMATWCNFYRDALGFAQIVSFDDKDISTEYTALMSNGNFQALFEAIEKEQDLQGTL